MSIRLRLTLLFSAILAVTLIGFGIALYLAVDNSTINVAKDALAAETKSIALAFHPRYGPDTGVPIVEGPPAAVIGPQTSVQTSQPDGTLSWQSDNLSSAHYVLPLDASTRGQVLQLPQGSAVERTATVGGQEWIICSAPIYVHGAPGPSGILQLARTLQDVERPLTSLRPALLAGGVGVTLLAFGIGWLLAGAALRPIKRMTQTAQAIGAAQDFARRVDYSGPADEVGRLATTFNTMLARLQAAFQTQRRFVADASHELRTPLTTIRGNLSLLQREPPIAEVDRVAVLADLVSESERLSRLVADLLTLARSDAGRRLRVEPVGLAPLVADLCRRFAVAYPDRAIHEEGRTDLAVIGDPDALMQVLLILLDNALKFTPADGAVTVETALDDGQVRISVRDTGSGIAAEALPHVFERFYQGDTARAGTGTGLGLAIAKALVEAQHGSIAVESQVGQGSVFSVTLPQAVPSAQPLLPSVSRS